MTSPAKTAGAHHQHGPGFLSQTWEIRVKLFPKAQEAHRAAVSFLKKGTFNMAAAKSRSSIFSTPGIHLHVDTVSFQIFPFFKPIGRDLLDKMRDRPHVKNERSCTWLRCRR